MYDTGTQSLAYMALVKIATTLWNQDIRALTDEFDLPGAYADFYDIGKKMEEKVIDKLPQLSQPGPVKKEILGFIKPICLRILTWMEYHRKFLSKANVKKSLNSLVWTPQGTVDSKKTAEALIKDEKLSITDRYKLACIYCLEDDIPKLWNKIPENRRKSFYREDPVKVNQHQLVVIWTHIIKGGGIAKMDRIIERTQRSQRSLYQCAFEHAIFDGNKVATEYFLKKLTFREREESIVSSAIFVAIKSLSCFGNRGDYVDVLCFLLSQMNEGQQIEVFEHSPWDVLKCFLEWPWQSLFMETANRMWDFLPERYYHIFLQLIIEKAINGYEDYDYQTLFSEFWLQSPDAYKRYVIHLHAKLLLSRLFKINDEKNIKLILKAATPMKKKELISCAWGQEICQHLVHGEQWNFLEFFIRDCIPSKSEMIVFKVKFRKRMAGYCSKEEFAKRKQKWDKFFELLGDFIREYNKRKNVEGISSPAKSIIGFDEKTETKNKKVKKCQKQWLK